MQRLPWPDYFMNITYLVSERSTCTRRRVGAVAVKDKRILATGYNGAPAGVPHCLEVGCLREQLGIPSGQRHEICRGLHAEQNVIIQAAVHGINIRRRTLLHYPPLCAVQQNADQLRHPPHLLRRGLSRRPGHGHAAGGRRHGGTIPLHPAPHQRYARGHERRKTP